MRIIYNAKIYTFDSGCPMADALAIDGEHLVGIGSDYDILSNYSQHAELFDAGGRTIIPGLADAHIHLEQYASNLAKVNCDMPSRQECLARIRQRAAVVPPGEWILGHGWNQNNWSDGFGTSLELDQVAPDNPVYLTAKSLHAAWANTSALHAAHITPDIPDPQGGRILRTPAGHPNGILLESAMQLVSSIIPRPTFEQRLNAIRDAISHLNSLGLTALHDFDQSHCLVALQALHDQGKLSIRVIKGLPLDDLPHAVALGLRTGFGDHLLRIGAIKVFSDGALGPRTAAMLQPYENEPDNRGILLLDAGELFEIGIQAVEHGFNLAVHAIGDRANHEVLDAFARLAHHRIAGDGGYPVRPLRHRIEHVQLISPDDMPRLATHGVIASMQPIHATSDMLMAEKFWGNRSATSYAWQSLLEQGTVLAFGSDAPVETPNPFTGLHAAVTRCRSDGTPGPNGWYPSQRLTRQQAFHAYTMGPAFAAGLENHLGRLCPGYLADLLVLEQDPFECDPSQLLQIRPTATMLGGEWVYQA